MSNEIVASYLRGKYGHRHKGKGQRQHRRRSDFAYRIYLITRKFHREIMGIVITPPRGFADLGHTPTYINTLAKLVDPDYDRTKIPGTWEGDRAPT